MKKLNLANKGWLRTESAAEYADVSPRLIKEWRRQGLRHIKVNDRLTLTRPEWLDDHIQAQDSQPDLDAILAELQGR